MNQRNQDRFGSSSNHRAQDGEGRWTRDRDRSDSMQSNGYGSSDRDWGNTGRDSFERDYRGSDRDRDDGRFGTQGYGMSNYGASGYGSTSYGSNSYGSERGAREYDMRDYNDGRSRLGRSDGMSGDRAFGSSDWRGGRGEEYRSGEGSFRGSNDYRSQSWRGGDDGYGLQGSGGMSSTVGGSYGMRNKGGTSGYGDVSDYGRGGGWGSQVGGVRTGIDYGAAANRGNQSYAKGDLGYGYRGRDDFGDRSFSGRNSDDRGIGERVEEWGHRAKEGIKEFFGGPKNYKRSDERIREDVCDRLQQLGGRGHLDPSDIEVTVKDGEVTLAGTVSQRDWKHRAEDLAEAISGVKEVDNRIRVQKQESSSFSSSSKTGRTSSTSSAASGLSGNGNTSTASAKS